METKRKRNSENVSELKAEERGKAQAEEMRKRSCEAMSETFEQEEKVKEKEEIKKRKSSSSFEDLKEFVSELHEYIPGSISNILTILTGN